MVIFFRFFTLIRLSFTMEFQRLQRAKFEFLSLVYQSVLALIVLGLVAGLANYLSKRSYFESIYWILLNLPFAAQLCIGLIRPLKDKCRIYNRFSFDWTTLSIYFTLRQLVSPAILIYVLWWTMLLSGDLGIAYPKDFYCALGILFMGVLSISLLAKAKQLQTAKVRKWIGPVLAFLSLGAFWYWGDVHILNQYLGLGLSGILVLILFFWFCRLAQSAFKEDSSVRIKAYTSGLVLKQGFFYAYKDFLMFVRCKIPRSALVGLVLLSLFYTVVFLLLGGVKAGAIPLDFKLNWKQFNYFARILLMYVPYMLFIAIANGFFAYHYRFFTVLMQAPQVLEKALSSFLGLSAIIFLGINLIISPSFVLFHWNLEALFCSFAIFLITIPFLSLYLFIQHPFRIGLVKANTWDKKPVSSYFVMSFFTIFLIVGFFQLADLVPPGVLLCLGFVIIAVYLFFFKRFVQVLARLIRKNKEVLLYALGA